MSEYLFENMDSLINVELYTGGNQYRYQQYRNAFNDLPCASPLSYMCQASWHLSMGSMSPEPCMAWASARHGRTDGILMAFAKDAVPPRCLADLPDPYTGAAAQSRHRQP